MHLTGHPHRLSPSAEHGTTLMEMLVAILTSLVVLAALFAILEFTINQETSIADRLSANVNARNAMSTIVRELQSSCTGFGATAIQAPSTTPTSPLKPLGGTNLWMISAYETASREAAVLTSVNQHDINWTETGKSSTGAKLGTLADYIFPSTGRSESTDRTVTWQFPTLSTPNARKTVLATNVIPPASGSLFTYYKYESTGTLRELSASEAETEAKKGQVAKIAISFTQAADNKDTQPGRTVSISDAVVLRFNTSTAGSELGTSPCV